MSEKQELLDRAVAELIAQSLDLYLSPAQVAGMLNINPTTLASIDRTLLPRYVLIEGKVVRYKLSEVRDYLEGRRES